LRYDWSSAAGFDAMDFRLPRGRITRYEIADFVRDHYTSLSEADLDAIIRRCDTDEDEALSFSEFEDAAGIVRVVAAPLLAPLPAPIPLASSLYYRSYYDPYYRSYIDDPVYRASLYRPATSYYDARLRETLRATYSPVRTLREYYSPARTILRETYSPVRTIREHYSPVRTAVVERSPYRASAARLASPVRRSPVKYSSPTRRSPFRNTSPMRKSRF